jgi:hypothetical protein
MKSLRSRLKVLTLLPAFLGLDSTRHLTEMWPQFADQSSRVSPVPEPKAPKRLRAQVEEVRLLLGDIHAGLDTGDDIPCRANARNALALLVDSYQKQVPYFLGCLGSCRASAARLEEFVDALRTLEGEIAGCLRQRTLNKWVLEEQTSLKGSFGAQTLTESNPRGEVSAGGDASAFTPSLDLGLRGVYRSQNSWHALRALTGFSMVSDQNKEFDYALEQENVLQLGSQALRIKGGFEKRGVWLWNQTTRGTRTRREVEAGWRLVPGSTRALEILGRWRDDVWSSSAWSLRAIGVDANYVLSETLHDDLKVVGGLSQETLKGLSSPVWVTRAGVAYKRKGSTYSSAYTRLGLQDRRVKSFGAGIWPDLALGLEGRDLFFSGLYPSFSLSLSPESTPWSAHTLMGKASWGLRYQRGAFEFPATLSVGQDFHRGLGGDHRDDRSLGAAAAPSYKLSSKATLSVPVQWTQFWILKSDISPETTDFNYPSRSYSNFETTLRLQYDF